MRRLAVALFSLVLLASSCSLGPREDWAKAMRDAHVKARLQKTAKVRMAVDVKVIETVIRQTPVPLIARLEGFVDFRNRRSKLIGAGPRKPSTIFDDLVAFLPRSAVTIGTSGKRWARFDFEREPSVDIDDTDRRRAVGAGMISPALATELLEGVLTGSIERESTAMIAGVTTTRYRAKLSQDAAAREVDDEDRREGLLRLFATLGVQDDLFPVEVWMDDRGLVRRISFVLRQQKDRVNAFELRLAWEFYDYGASIPAIRLPARADLVTPKRFRAFVEDYIREEA
jgi:hypothetical protein